MIAASLSSGATRSRAQAEGCNESAIAAFKYNFAKLTSGESLMIGEGAISPVDELPAYESLSETDPRRVRARARHARARVHSPATAARTACCSRR